VRSDGVYFEQSLYYHVYALDFLLHTRLLAALNGVEIPSPFDDVIRRMLAVVEALAQAAPPDGFGDDDGGRLFNPRRNRAEHMTDPLAVGAALFHDHSLSLHAPLTEEAIWLFGADAMASEAQRGGQMSTAASHGFLDGGLYVLGSQGAIVQSMVVDAGPQGTGRSGHGHADALSIKLSLAGRNVLVDSGTFVYIAPGPERQTFRGTRTHNTITVDGLDQAEQEGPFAWRALPTTQAEWWIRGNTFTVFRGSHSGYERLAQPVRHRRFVFHLHGGCWLLRDVVEGTGTHLLESSWHFAPDVEAFQGENLIQASIPTGSKSTSPGAAHLTILPVPDPRWRSDLLMTQISPVYGVTVPTRVLRLSALVPTPAEHAILLFPSTDSTGAKAKFSRIGEPPPTEPALEAIYSFDFSESSHTAVFGKGTPEPWSFGPWTSDSKFLYFCVNKQKVVHLICCHGSFARLLGESVFSWGAPLQYLEWINQAGRRSSFSSDKDAVGSLFEDALAAGILV
jgi:hypothetical protein